MHPLPQGQGLEVTDPSLLWLLAVTLGPLRDCVSPRPQAAEEDGVKGLNPIALEEWGWGTPEAR